MTESPIHGFPGGVATADGAQLGAMASVYVLITAVIAPWCPSSPTGGWAPRWGSVCRGPLGTRAEPSFAASTTGPQQRQLVTNRTCQTTCQTNHDGAARTTPDQQALKGR